MYHIIDLNLYIEFIHQLSYYMNSNTYTVIYCKVSACNGGLYCHIRVQFCSIAMRIFIYMTFVSDKLVSLCYWDTLFFYRGWL